MATLESHHALRAVGQPVNDLALALITPLGADHYDVLGHIPAAFSYLANAPASDNFINKNNML
jgi:hypothetical protein